MYLSKLELMGFKSFAQKTKLQFTDGISCVIGPNGSGKSNIVDAIRWVLGEQKVSMLRMDKMESVIFNGSKDHKPLNMAEVSLTVNNNKNVLSSEFTDVVISRRLYRSGESQYFINKSPCRLKDIQTLFMDTGMGANSYSVIELNMVESIISENPAERRHLFEEAAGVTKYKSHRKSALRKLDATRQDMSRIEDIISEISRNVNSLSRQVGKARRYLKFQEELKNLDLDVARYKYTQLQDQITPMRKTLEEISLIKEDASQQITLEEAILEEYKRELIQFEQRIGGISKQVYTQDEQLHQIKEQSAIAQTRSQNLHDNIKRNHSDIEDYNQKTELLNGRLTENNSALAGAEKDFQVVKKTYEKEEAAFRDMNLALKENKIALEESNNAYRELSLQVQNLKETGQKKKYQLQWNEEQIKIFDQEHHSLKDTKNILEADIKKIQALIKEKLKQRDDLKKEESDLEQKISSLGEKSQRTDENINKCSNQVESLTAQLSFYENVISNYQGHLESTRKVMMNKNQFPGIHGPLSDLIEIPQPLVSAVEVALGEAVNYLIVDTLDSAEKILLHVEQNELGRVTLVPLDRLKSLQTSRQKITGDQFLIDKISFKPTYETIIRLLLGDVAVVKSLKEALTASEKNAGLRYVTEKGEIISGFHGISGGQKKDPKTSLLGRKDLVGSIKKDIGACNEKAENHKKELAHLQNEKERDLETLQKFKNELHALEERIRDLERQETEIKVQMQNKVQAIEKREQDKNNIIELIASLQKEIRESDKQLQSQEKELGTLDLKIAEISGKYEEQESKAREQGEKVRELNVEMINTRNHLSNREAENNRLIADIVELGQLTEKRKAEIEQMTAEIEQIRIDSAEREKSQALIKETRYRLENEKSTIEQSYHEVKDKIINLENQIKKFRKQHDSSLERTRQLELDIKENEMKCESIKDRIHGEYNEDVTIGISFDGLNVEESEREIESLKFKIRQMGQVNPLAVSEYERENERLEFFTKQYDDLKKAEKSLLETINKINTTARNLFMETFDQIKVNFERVFSSFFVNGEGTLRIDEETDPLESNIEIMVRPKGNRMQTISLLSGGEKTLTAISLLFSIYLVKPSPFCILDEIDAPLDDVNIGRFTNALGDFSKETQFIVVTHNKRTMESAGTLYGVTMEEEGLSKLVSVKFN